jgi:GGDEF domain-containing protein
MTVLNQETFAFVLANELKRAARSQNYVTLVLMEPRSEGHAVAIREIVEIVSRELRETDLLANDDTVVSMVLLDADVENSTCVMERVMARLEHYRFASPLDIHVGAACCPVHGADAQTLRHAAEAARTGMARRGPRGSAHAQ